MLFLELWFWAFAAIATGVYWLCPSPWKAPWLLAASLVFHAHFAGPAGMAPILVLAVLTYVVGIALASGDRRHLFVVTCSIITGALAFYKYSSFAMDNLGIALESWSAPAAPLAISFFTFEFVHYLYEVRVSGRDPIRNPLHFALFAVFFPTLASGPVKRFPDFVPQLERLENPSLEEVGAALRRIIRGLFKKVCIADLTLEVILVLEDSSEYPAPLVVSLAILQGFRIYYDFAGYSDIAIGLAQLFRLRVPENFDRPYFATSLQDFWRRWHMSLTSWIRDYVYIPLGGNRRHQAVNQISAMALCGLWHGAAWNFVAWGVYHGLGLAIEARLRRAFPVWFESGGGAALARWAVCYAFVCYGWLLFFYPFATVVVMTREAVAWFFIG